MAALTPVERPPDEEPVSVTDGELGPDELVVADPVFDFVADTDPPVLDFGQVAVLDGAVDVNLEIVGNRASATTGQPPEVEAGQAGGVFEGL